MMTDVRSIETLSGVRVERSTDHVRLVTLRPWYAWLTPAFGGVLLTFWLLGVGQHPTGSLFGGTFFAATGLLFAIRRRLDVDLRHRTLTATAWLGPIRHVRRYDAGPLRVVVRTTSDDSVFASLNLATPESDRVMLTWPCRGTTTVDMRAIAAELNDRLGLSQP